MSIVGEMESVGSQIERASRALGVLQDRRRALIVRGLAAGMTEREIAELVRCAPSFVNRVSSQAG